MRKTAISMTGCQLVIEAKQRIAKQRCKFYTSVLRFFSEYPAMGVHPLLLEWHGSVMTIGDAR